MLKIWQEYLTALYLQNIHDKHSGAEFRSEVRTLEKIEHLNLVKFYGFLEHGEEKILVVEYVSNGTLREHLDSKFLILLLSFHLPSIFCSSIHNCGFQCLFIMLMSFNNAGVDGNVLDFASRLDIGIDVGHAITYLHMYTGTSELCALQSFLNSWLIYLGFLCSSDIS